jgi:hypothetical protein
MLSGMVLLAVCCALLASMPDAPSAPSPHPGWEPLAADLRLPVEIDRRRVRRAHGFVEIWVRSRDRAESVAGEFAAAGVGPDAVERVRRNFHHAEHLWSFHCEGGTHALAHAAYFADDGTLIRAFPVERRAYWPVAPDTLGKRIQQVACTLPSAPGDLVDVRENATGAQEDAASSGSR